MIVNIRCSVCGKTFIEPSANDRCIVCERPTMDSATSKPAHTVGTIGDIMSVKTIIYLMIIGLIIFGGLSYYAV